MESIKEENSEESSEIVVLEETIVQIPKYYVNSAGVFLGGLIGLEPEDAPGFEDAIEVPYPPLDGRQIWDFANSIWLELILIPESISQIQFWMQMAEGGFCTETEAEDALSGTLPADMLTRINTLPSSERFAARAKIKGIRDLLRISDTSTLLMGLYNWDNSAMDAFFIAAAQL